MVAPRLPVLGAAASVQPPTARRPRARDARVDVRSGIVGVDYPNGLGRVKEALLGGSRPAPRGAPPLRPPASGRPAGPDFLIEPGLSGHASLGAQRFQNVSKALDVLSS